MKKIIHWLLFCCILTGIFFRFYNLRYNSQFTWDQENSLAFPAWEILVKHHFPLIGAKTGIGDLYLSPYYSYLAALFYWIFRLDPIAGAISSGVLSTATILIGYLCVKKMVHKQAAIYFALIWAASPFILELDRIPWNVNLFPLAALLSLSDGWFLIGSGLFIGLNAHFSALFLFAILIVLFVSKKNQRKNILIGSLIALTVGLSPLIVFNFRHGNILLTNLEKILSGSITSIDKLIARFIAVLFTELEVLGRFIVSDGPAWLQQTIAILFIFFLHLSRKEAHVKKYISVFSLYFIVYLLGYTIYSGALPEYYFIGLVTVAAVGWGILLSRLVQIHSSVRVPLLLISLVLILQGHEMLKDTNPQSIGVKQDVVKIIKENVKNQQFSIIYDMDLGWSFGYEYLWHYYGLEEQKKTQAENIYWLSYPKSRFPGNPDVIISNIAIGFSPASHRILSTKDVNFYTNLFRMRIPRAWTIVSCPSIDFDAYLISPDLSANCNLSSQAMLILNEPNCSLSKLGAIKITELKNGLEVYELSHYPFSSFRDMTAYRIFATFFEKDRCVGFIDSFQTNSEHLQFVEMLESLRLRVK